MKEEDYSTGTREKDLSPEAKKLLDLCGLNVDEEGKIPLSKALTENPDLVKALDEYIAFRDQHTRSAEEKNISPKVGHSKQNIEIKIKTESKKPKK